VKVIVVANQKGGVGKTTVVFHLSWLLAEKGDKVLAIDLDPQGNLSWCMAGISDNEECAAATIFENEKIKMQEITENLWLTASNIKLARFEAVGGGVNVYFRFRKALEKLAQEQSVDWVVVDCPPSLGLFSLSALVAAEILFIPMRAEIFSVAGLGDLLNVTREIQENINPRLYVAGMVLNAVRLRTRVAKNTLEELSEMSGELKIPVVAVLPATIRVEEALRKRVPVWRLGRKNHVEEKIRAEFQKLVEVLGENVTS